MNPGLGRGNSHHKYADDSAITGGRRRLTAGPAYIIHDDQDDENALAFEARKLHSRARGPKVS